MDRFLDFCRTYQTSLMLFLQGVCVAIAFLTIFMRYLKRSRKLSIIFLELTAAANLAASRFYYLNRVVDNTAYWPWVRAAKFLDYFFVLAIILCFNFYVKDLLRNEGGLKRIPRMLFAVDAILAAGAVTLFINLHTGFYYYFDATNVYTHGAYNFVWYIFPMTPLLIQLLAIVINYKHFPRIMRIPLVLFIVIPLLMAVAQFLVTDLAPGVISTVGMAIVLYVFSIEEMNKSIDRAHKREITMMAKYQKTLEDTVDLRTHELKVANEKVESLLLNILPENIARELAENPNKTISKTYPNATVLFADIVGFTQMSDKMTAEETVLMLNKMTILFDDRAKRAGVEKIKTIGDAYMAAAGLTEDDSDDGVELMIRFARGMIEDVEQVGREMGIPLKIRIGINSGELVAGVIGKTKFIYDVWGDTVNIASRMESTGDPMRIHLSEAAYSRISSSYPGLCSVPVDVKGKGMMNGYFL